MTEQYTAIQASIIEWKQCELDNTKIIYTIEVQKTNGTKWQLKKRYKEFDELNKNIKKLYANIPAMPGKTLFKIKDNSEIDKRKQGLDTFLKQIVQRPDIFHSEFLNQFLEIDQHTTDQSINPPKLLGELTGFIHGVRDFHYESNTGLLFVLCGDMNVASRMDAYLTNMKMPWEKEQPQTLLSVGTLECWIQQQKSDKFQFDRVWSLAYPSQAICMHWEPISQILTIGLDEGKIHQIKVPQDYQFLRFEKVLEYQPHEYRIMGVHYDNINDIIYTCSEDKTIKTIENNQCINVLKHSDTGLTCMLADKEFKRLFVSNRSGNIYIYSISSINPELLITVQTIQKGTIRGLTIDLVKNYLFTGGFDDGEICVFDIEKPGKEKFAKLSASLVGKKKVRSIQWSTSRSEIYVGTYDGTITIWNAKKGQPIYVMKGHNHEITKLQWFESNNMLVSSAKEKSIKFWQMPKEWRDKLIEQQEEKLLQEVVQTQNFLKAKEQIKKVDEDSDEDDLAGWHQY
ncbi:PX domain protein [Ichthyophthirius multifiliis]|uniref:PX domain protein n=1 Tax=Ichthyophthirius multifiliis TaxID=5932 RepID=G0QNG1_ICHMU|nr:PX domain protein [Ichthyophthirius multifiliis]EGR33250.1 PX domain protein [Ichthyophthirius multifiliis]|eukprot:XP_004037236.1 PX domain protein [Ichthyophthirius multifiliis]